MDAGFVLALPFHHGDLKPDCVGVSTRGGRVWGPSTKREEASLSVECEAEKYYRR